MVKMIIVEDEPLMNEYLSGCLEWHKFGILLCGVFFNGQTAYEFLEQNQIDIVVTDIKMPGLDGLSLISRVTAEQPHVKFVIISSYDDFHMVKEAFLLGVSDYILKTEFEPESFQKILVKLIEGMSPSREQNGITPAMRELQLRQFFWGSIGSKMSLAIPGFEPDRPHEIAVLRILNYDTVIKNQWNVEKELMKYGLSNCIEEILETFKVGHFFFNTYDEIIFLFSTEAERETDPLTQVMEKLYTVMHVNFGLTIACGFCRPSAELDVKRQYQRAVMALEYTFIFGLQQPVLYDDICSYCDEIDATQLFKEAEKAISLFDYDALTQRLAEAEAWHPSSADLPIVRDFYKKLLLLVFGVSGEQSQGINRSFEELTGSLWTAQDYAETIREFSLQLFGKKTYSAVVIGKVQDYIRKNYSRNITLQLLAQEFHFDYTDLSRRFQKITGKSFRRFLSEVRLNEAMQPIQTTDFKLVEISSMVGYNNYENFSRSFKKQFQKWPNEIRKAET